MATDRQMERLDEKGFRTQIKQWATDTSLHAVKYLVESTKLRRIVWILITIAVTVAFLVQFVLSLQMFFRYDSTTSIEQEEREELTLPSITICNANVIKRSTVEQKDPAMVKTFKQLMEIIYGLRTNTTLTRPESIKQITFLEFCKRASHRQEDFFLWCSVGHTVVKCSDYITEAVTNAGFCYTFNSKESIGRNGNLVMREPGPYDGFNFILDTEPDDYLIMNGFGVGVRFVIHEPDINPLVNTGSCFAAPGEETFFSLTKLQTAYLQPPYSTMDCVAEEDLVRKGAELGLELPTPQRPASQHVTSEVSTIVQIALSQATVSPSVHYMTVCSVEQTMASPIRETGPAIVHGSVTPHLFLPQTPTQVFPVHLFCRWQKNITGQ